MSFSEALGLIMLVGMVAVIFIGFPISFTLLFLALVFGGLGLGWEQTFNLAYLQIWGTMKDEIFPAVPLFIFMGYMTEQAGLMERLFGALRSLLAPVRGSLYLAVILTATIFAMATGIVGAAVTVLGIMAAPMMIKSGYDARLSAGAIAAGGTLGILIPPSVMLVVMGPVMGVPVNLLYSAAFGPGFLLAGCYIAYTLVRSFINPKLGPAMTMEERKAAYDDMTTEKVGAPVVGLGLVCLMAMTYLLADVVLGRLGVPPLAVSVGPFAVSGVASGAGGGHGVSLLPQRLLPRHRAGHRAAERADRIHARHHRRRVGDADRGRFVRRLRRHPAGAGLRPARLQVGHQRGHGHDGDLGHGAVPGRGLQRVRRRLHQARLGEPDHELRSSPSRWETGGSWR